MNVRREQQLVDPYVQGGLVARSMLTAIFGVVVCGLCFLFRDWIFGGGSTTLYEFGPILAALVIVIPLVVFEAVKASNRVVAPLIRMRHACRLIAEEKRIVGPIAFRDNDAWKEWARDFNTMLEVLREETTLCDEGGSTTPPDEPGTADPNEPISAHEAATS